MSVSEVPRNAGERGLSAISLVFVLLLASAALLLLSLVFPTPARGFLFGIGAGLVALAVLMMLSEFISWLRRSCAKAWFRVRTGRGRTPCFLSDRQGRTLARAGVASSRGDAHDLERWLGALVVAPRRDISNLLRHLGHAGRFETDLGTATKYKATLSRTALGYVFWRFEIPDVAENAKDQVSATRARKGMAGQADAPDLLNALPVPLLKIAADGSIREANLQARKLLLVENAEVPPLFELVEGMGRPISDWIEDAIAGRGLLKPEIVRALVPGQDLFLQITLGRVEDESEALLIAVLNDATELKSLEAQFVQSQKMQAIGQLAGGVAHDFNNLLTAISGHCDLLLLRHDPGDPAFADLKQIEQNANRAASLVGQLLAFSRKQNLRAQPVDLRDTMSDLTHLLNRLVEETIQLDLAHEPGAKTIRADSRQLEQVIMNLVVNARDAMPEGGRIKIRTLNTHLEQPMLRDRVEVPAGDYVVVTVSDEGIGIEPEVLPKVFEPFYTTKKTGEGTGLGLSTAYGIVKQSGGYIFVDSKSGEGTTFSLYFPAHVSKETTESATVTPEKGPASGRRDGVVLLVEDEAPVRAFATRALRMRGMTVIEADCAEAALEVLEDPEMIIDVFVTDVIMPGMDGPTWVRKALKKRPETKVVFVSGYAEESLAENQSRVPNSVFLPKPFSLNQLTSLVQEQLV